MKAIGRSVGFTKIKFWKYIDNLEIRKFIGKGMNLVRQFWIVVWLFIVMMNI